MSAGPHDADLERVGRAAAPLVLRFHAWIHRRVTTFELEGAEFGRVRESVDFTLPPELVDALTVPGSGTYVPFGWLLREPLRGFDLEVGGKAVPMVTAEEGVTIHAAIVDALTATRPEAVEPLLEGLGTSFVALAVLPAPPTARTVLKYSYDSELPWPPDLGASGKVILPLPTATLTGSHHLDVVLPTELRSPGAELVDEATRARLPHAPVLRNVDRVAFHSRREELAGAQPAVSFSLTVEPGAFSLPALVVTAALLALLLAGWFADPAALPSTATAILFASSGALVAIAQRTPDSELVRRRLRLPRGVLVASGLSVLVAAAAVGLELGRWEARAAWGLALLVVALSAIALLAIVASGSRRDAAGAVEDAAARPIALGVGVVTGALVCALGFNPALDLTRTWWASLLFLAAALAATLITSRRVRAEPTD